ncbi:magnetosome protein Mad24 [Candidatus Magnetoovum chiemensis]|nr:magnetosome protein Mad24 [Candidatus Magnetoovum chiemensis]
MNNYNNEQDKKEQEIMKNKLMESKESITDYSDFIGSEQNSLASEINNLETENTELFKKSKELEIKLREKQYNAQQIYKKLAEINKEYIEPLSDENSIDSEVRFLEQERIELIESYKTASDTLFNNIANIGNTLIYIDYLKSEIMTLRDKMSMAEHNLPTKKKELETFIDKIKWTRNAINELYKNMHNSKIKTKEFYYQKQKQKTLPYNK